MSGALITSKIEDAGINGYLADIEARLGSQRPAWELIGEILLTSTLERFETHSDPDGNPWVPVSPRYAKWKEEQGFDPANILILHRILMASLHWEAGDDHATVGTDVIYAAIHQLGGYGVPGRAYLGIADSDLSRISDALSNYVVS